MKLILILLIVVVFLGIAACCFLSQEKFGKAPAGERLARVQNSPNYKNGGFQNQVYKPALSEGVSSLSIALNFLFRPNPQGKPAQPLPAIKTDLRTLPPDQDILVWFGHSSYYLQLAGKKMLVDPSFSGMGSPFSFAVLAFPYTENYQADDMPDLDYVFITHDHWDHLDYETILQLKNRTGKFICSLGVGEHLEYWEVAPEKIIENDWYGITQLDPGFTVYVLPTHHFSGRGLQRNNTLWASYVLETPTLRLYFGGDSGYGGHFADTGSKFDYIDVAILENGQYNLDWKYHHMQPEETLQAAVDLKAKTFIPVHSGKFELAHHPWKEPLSRINSLALPVGLRLLTPRIGEPIFLQGQDRTFTPWWEEAD